MPKPNTFSGLLQDVCVNMGFCGSVVDGELRHVSDYIPESGTVTAEQFANWVIIAEGMQPAYSEWHSRIMQKFVRHMGHDEVDASRLK